MVVTKTIRLTAEGYCDLHNITGEVQDNVSSSGINSGTVTVFVPGSTGGLTTIEYEPGLIQDMPDFMEKIIPSGVSYKHDETWHDGNGFSHLRAALIGPSLTVPFISRKLTLGTWQQIVFIDFDNKSRERELILQIVGD
ncbi:MAG: secondary thiamine-phosphate synthase enzyme YjbQ [candidate division Zixibacteria bacterium]|nr:secondary thiamine-phosphate synthase enzyme YjbQ [candidate division Zixibacteria bacterium]